MGVEELETRVNDLTRQVEFCNDMTILLFLGFYIIILSALLCCYLFTRYRLEQVKSLPPPPPPTVIVRSIPIELERLLNKLIERLPVEAPKTSETQQEQVNASTDQQGSTSAGASTSQQGQGASTSAQATTSPQGSISAQGPQGAPLVDII
jgi:hypothetical protein